MRKLKILTKMIFIMASAVVLSGSVSVINMENVYAASESEEVVGKIYEFGEKEEYDISTAKKVSSTEEKSTYGTLSVSGKINTVGDKNGIPAYGVEKGTISISYTYDDKMLKASEDKKHLVEDKSNKVNEIELKDDILNGAIILQTSKDGVHWYSVPEKTKTNVLKKIQREVTLFIRQLMYRW